RVRCFCEWAQGDDAANVIVVSWRGRKGILAFFRVSEAYRFLGSAGFQPLSSRTLFGGANKSYFSGVCKSRKDDLLIVSKPFSVHIVTMNRGGESAAATACSNSF